MNSIDLRSDTVTLPPPEMKRAMMEAELGDDVFGDDPTVNRLQAMAAEMLGKEAALFTTSGTQSNLIAMLTHCPRGREVIVGESSHILFFEQGGAWALGGLGLHGVRTDSKGRLDLGDDPTVNRLQTMAAEMLGKEAALFTTSGTQSNLIAMLTHCPRGREVIVGESSHILFLEQGGAWALGGLGLHGVRTDSKGRLDLGDVRAWIRPDNEHFPRTGLICVENTHNRAGGTVLGEEDLASVRDLADKHGLPVHMDGARIFNAAVKLGVPVSRLAAYADTVSFSLSKGLACPVGSVLAGSKEFIREAHRYRKVLGGGMRQVGIIAGAGVYALENMVQRLADDHANALAAAEGLAQMPGVTLTPPPETNLVYFTVDDWKLPRLVEKLEEAGVRCFDEGGRIRWVTHYGIERADIDQALERTRAILAAGA